MYSPNEASGNYAPAKVWNLRPDVLDMGAFPRSHSKRGLRPRGASAIALLLLALASTGFVALAPILAARGGISLMTMSVLAYATNLVLLLLVVVAGVLSVLKRTSGPLTVAACLASVTCLAVSHLLLQPQKLDAMFLRQFASRVDNEVGFAALQTFASSVRADVETRSEERRVGKECRSRWSPH